MPPQAVAATRGSAVPAARIAPDRRPPALVGVPVRTTGVPAEVFSAWASLDDDALVVVEDDSDRLRITWVNKACAQLFGYAEEELTGGPLSRLLRSPFAPGADDQEPDARLLVDPRRTLRRDVSLERRDGSRVRLGLASVPVGSADDRRWVVRMVPEPDVAKVADDLRASHERFQALADRAPIAIFSSDAGLRLGYVNDRFSELLGESAERLLGTEWLSFVHPDDLGTTITALQSALTGTPYDLPLRLVNSNGVERHVHARIVPVRTSRRDTGFVGTLEDVTERQAWERMLAYQASHDPLTRLPNRRQLFDALVGHMDQPGRPGIALVFLDLDEFKLVNDSLGHDAGDHLLMEVADRLRNAVREDDLVSRFGGDEFAILCLGVNDEAHAAHLARRLLEAVTGPVALGTTEFSVSASLGVVLLSNEHQGPEDLLRDADVAMYQAKAAGKNCVALFDERARADAQERLSLVSDLRRTIEADGLDVVYQPVVRVAQSWAHTDLTATASVEALVRWHHPLRGSISPQDFVALAEQNGLVVALGEQVLRKACWQMIRWQEELGDVAPASVSVNVSPIQLRHPGLVDTVAGILEETGLPGHRLCLELTESVVMHDSQAAAASFTSLRALGVRVSIDDFGTGYSSLAMLRCLPVDQLKIDRSLLQELLESPRDPVVAAVVALAQALNLDVVAEGVETQQQLAELARLGCGHAQGFLFSLPLPGDELGLALAAAAEEGARGAAT
jgi:diguanylate cyclase (GGDEF)-like protein/PAS domain S-box-containing protein